VACQTRNRQNLVAREWDLKQTAHASAVHKHCLKKFDDQETEIEQLRATIKSVPNTEHQQRAASRLANGLQGQGE
jgi:hypothetical protein